jgi:hypothetical protein
MNSEPFKVKPCDIKAAKLLILCTTLIFVISGLFIFLRFGYPAGSFVWNFGVFGMILMIPILYLGVLRTNLQSLSSAIAMLRGAIQSVFASSDSGK